MADDAVAVLEAQANEIRERIEPKRQEIADDEQMLARLEAAIAMLRGEVAISSGRSRADAFRAAATGGGSSRRPRGSVKEAILNVVRERPGVSAAEVAEAVGGSKASVTSSLQKMASDGEVQKENLGGRRVGFKIAA